MSTVDPITPTTFSPWKRGIYWLLLLGPLFFLSYGQVNQFTATRNDVGSLVFHWEQAIPFMPWTIVPYWSIDLLYGLSLFICTSRQEQTRHAWRLLSASLIACSGFLLFPLEFTFTRPDSPGVFGWLFRQLELFDLPYNQAPSLHIILTWLLWLRFRQHLSGPSRWLVGGWFWLIAVSVLTTWQHHVIDVISGIVVGMVISYVIPINGRWHWQKTSSRHRELAGRYALSGVILSALALWLPGCLILFWPATALCLVAVGYVGAGSAIFQKTEAGRLSLSARWLLWPYLLGARLSAHWFSRRIPPFSVITDGVAVGGFQAHRTFAAVLDLTAEFHRRDVLSAYWISQPLLDLVVPELHELQRGVNHIRQLRQHNTPVLVCCALGLSRSACVVAAWLLAEQHATSVEQAVDLIRVQRPQVVLTAGHLQRLQHFKEQLCPTFV